MDGYEARSIPKGTGRDDEDRARAGRDDAGVGASGAANDVDPVGRAGRAGMALSLIQN